MLVDQDRNYRVVVVIQLPLSIEVDSRNSGEALPYVSAIVGGQPVRALLDTGAARTTVAPPAGSVIETRPGQGTGVFGGEVEDRLVWRTTVEFGDRRIGPIELDTRLGNDGRDLLGQDVLSHFRCEYRLAEAVLRLDGPVPRMAEPLYLDRGNHIYLTARWDNASAAAVFDTGASLSVVDTALVDRYPHLFIEHGESEGTDASGSTTQTPIVEMAGPAILGHRFANTMAAAVDLGQVNATLDRPMDLILGWPVIQQANWFIDHTSRTAALVD